MTSHPAPAIALTMGEPAGIGGEIALAAAVFPAALPVLAEPLVAAVSPGKPDVANAPAVIRSIERAVALVTEGRASAVVTNPIQKATLYDAGFSYPGHTEFLAALAGPQTPAPVMMLACSALRVVPVTIHLALADVATQLTTENIVHAGRVTAAALRYDFGIAAPRLSVAGLNPHAGESGTIGRQEEDVIAPAIATLQADGINATGPHVADTLFHEAARAHYDAAICMYHDQALIPIKTIDFSGGVNVTLGLPFIRTSPDHGTALDIAGAGTADTTSLLAALHLAADMAATRASR